MRYAINYRTSHPVPIPRTPSPIPRTPSPIPRTPSPRPSAWAPSYPGSPGPSELPEEPTSDHHRSPHIFVNPCRFSPDQCATDYVPSRPPSSPPHISLTHSPCPIPPKPYSSPGSPGSSELPHSHTWYINRNIISRAVTPTTPLPSLPPSRASSAAVSRKSSIPSVRAASVPPLSVSDAYNFADWNIAFEVEDTLYRVHKFFFRRESSTIADMISCSPEGQPIPLTGVTRAQFNALLEFMYSAIFEPESMNVEQWIAILHLSNLWSMTRVREQALKHLNALEPVEKIVIAAKEDVQEWFFPAFVSLVEREEPLSIGDARKLISLGETRVGPVVAIDTVSLLAKARERWRSQGYARAHVEDVASNVLDEY